jgi:exonuclease III
MKTTNKNEENDVNGTPQNILGSVAFGRRGNRASLVVNKRNPCLKSKEKASLKIGTWNVRTMQRAGKLANVIGEMRRAEIQILGLAEVRWKNDGDFISEGIRVIYAGGEEHQRGVALLLEKKVAECVTGIERYGDRIVVVKIKAEPTNMVIVQVYMPTTSHEDEEIEEMYETLEKIIKQVKGTEYLVVMGDWNAIVGEGRENNCIGRYGLGERNSSGERLVEFCEQHKLVATNTWFKQEKRRRYTWKAPGDIARYQLDYILVRHRYRNSVKNSHAYPGADADTDHNLVMMNVSLTLKNVKHKSRKRRWDIEKLKVVGQEFASTVEKQMEGEGLGAVEERWEQLKNVITTEAKKTVGYKNGIQPKKPWVTTEMLKKMEERRKVKHQSNETAKTEYKRLNNELRRVTEKAKEQWWEEQCKTLEEFQQQGRYDKVYEKTRELTKKGSRKSNAVKDSNGNLLTEEDAIKDRWKEYIEELYEKDNRPTDAKMNENCEKPENPEEWGPDLMREEVENAIEELKNGKTEGIDDIPAEMLKNLGEKATTELISICQQIYASGEWPKDFTQTVMIPIPKKANATECSDHRTISLTSHASKIMLKILTRRMEGKVEATKVIGEDQFGFRRGRGTRDAIGVLRSLGERRLQHGKDLYICFVDYEKAFDRVNWCKLMEALAKIGVDWKDRRLIRNLYMEQTVMVRVNGVNSQPGKIGRGVRQGCPLSPLLFNIYIEMLVTEALERVDDGIKVGGSLMKAIRFADDQAMVASSNAGLQRIMNTLEETSEEYGMKINRKKTKVMRMSKYEGKRVKIVINGEEIEQVHQFCYLGSLITEDCRCTAEIKRRIAMGKESFWNRGELLRGKLKMDLKKRMIKSLVWSVALYGAETWTMGKAEVERLEAFEMWLWRRMAKISWEDYKTNEEVLQMVQEERTLIETIRKRQRNWLGHMWRGDSLLRTVLEGRMEGKKPPGRPRKMMLDWLMDREEGRGYKEIKEKAQNRQEWSRWNLGPA